jgi:hypothetical protein
MSNVAYLGRQAAALVKQLTSAASPSAPLPDVVDVGVILWSLSDSLKDALDEVKQRMRTEAAKRGGTTCLLDAPLGVCQVVTNPPVPVVANIQPLRDALGADFDKLFESTLTYKVRPDFTQRLLTLSPSVQQAVLQRLKMPDPTPRVSFRARD